jgi:ATP-dependent DNA helicase RecQ
MFGQNFADDFRDELLAVSAKAIKEFVQDDNVRILTYVPSLNNTKVKVFAEKLAKMLKLEFVDVIVKTDAPPQKMMANSSHQCQNAMQSFSIPSDIKFAYSAILVDDIVDSRWTLAVCANLLGEIGCPVVIPFCLADSSEGDVNE